MRVQPVAALVFAALACEAGATDVTVVGLFSGKAVVTVNRGAPRTLSVGQTTPEGVKLLAVDAKGATLEVDGRREVLEMGQHFEAPAQADARQSVSIAMDSSGHFIVNGAVNGGYVRFLVDTGASTVALSAAEAMRLGIDYTKGRRFTTQTANGTATAYMVLLDRVTVGDITLFNVEGAVLANTPPLLGMSFLNRTEMQRVGPNLTLTKKY